MIRKSQRGAALILALMLTFVLSILGITVMFISQTETWSTMNYRLMTQARYGAEAGVQRSLDYLVNTYLPPGTGVGDPVSNYNIAPTQPVAGLPAGINQAAVSYGGNAVVLSGNSSVTSNYPVSAVQTAFSAATSGTLASGETTVSYSAYATLISMNSSGVQIWLITSDGAISGVRTADVQVQTILERQSGTPLFTYGAFSTNNGCGAMTLSGGTTVNSYNSSAITCTSGTAPSCSGGHPVFATTGGNVGTNGNLGESGGATIQGTLSTPRAGVGTCSSGNVTGLTTSNGATVTGGEIQLPQAAPFPSPVIPIPAPPTTTLDPLQGCPGATCYAGITVGSGNRNYLAAPGTYPNMTLSGGITVHFSKGVYNMNSLTMGGGATLVIDSGPVVLNITGASQATPVDLSGGSLTNGSLDPSQFLINYAGTGSIKLSGGAGSAAVLYAPNAALSLSNGSDFYGAVVSATLTDTGGAAIHYDRNLQGKFVSVGNWMIDSFTWKKY